jgi:hypothetical protein
MTCPRCPRQEDAVSLAHRILRRVRHVIQAAQGRDGGSLSYLPN